MTITKLYFTRSVPAHYVAQIGDTSDAEGLFLLPCTVGGAAQDMAALKPFRGNIKTLVEVAPHLVMSLAFGGYPIAADYYEAAKAANSERVAH